MNKKEKETINCLKYTTQSHYRMLIECERRDNRQKTSTGPLLLLHLLHLPILSNSTKAQPNTNMKISSISGILQLFSIISNKMKKKVYTEHEQ